MTSLALLAVMMTASFTLTSKRGYNEVIMIHDKPYVPQKFINMVKIQKNAEYFAEAKAIWEELGLLTLMNFYQNYDPILLAQFYATAHFSTSGDRKIT